MKSRLWVTNAGLPPSEFITTMPLFPPVPAYILNAIFPPSGDQVGSSFEVLAQSQLDPPAAVGVHLVDVAVHERRWPPLPDQAGSLPSPSVVSCVPSGICMTCTELSENSVNAIFPFRPERHRRRAPPVPAARQRRSGPTRQRGSVQRDRDRFIELRCRPPAAPPI